MQHSHEFAGELLGTLTLVFFRLLLPGDGVVQRLQRPLPGGGGLGDWWGLAIYATRHLSCAHLNPGLSLAMVGETRFGPHFTVQGERSVHF
ncbi:MAG: hypothetical protein HGA96_04905 [Desulfobulbaceae bacterium]|nr:hypothetical protein [Desulfobulbaceae bacterium]